uniref:Uncharacterized protein n=1 Tax=Panagrolaimus superbus TaxID=310955 RepID=A0A914YFW0_9BILA
MLKYREKYFCDPEEILVLLEPKNQKYYASGDERAFVLRDFNVHSYELLKVKPQFYRNRFYKENTSAFGALRDALIQRLKLTNLRIDPRFFWLEKILFLKYEAQKNQQLFPLLMEIFSLF